MERVRIRERIIGGRRGLAAGGDVKVVELRPRERWGEGESESGEACHAATAAPSPSATPPLDRRAPITEDVQGVRREGSIPPVLSEKWKKKLKEHSTYKLTFISVLETNAYTRLIDTSHQLELHTGNCLQPLSESLVPLEPLYYYGKLNEISYLMRMRDTIRDITVADVDTRLPLQELSVTKFVELFVTVAKLYPMSIVLTVWQNQLLAHEKILGRDFRKQSRQAM